MNDPHRPGRLDEVAIAAIFLTRLPIPYHGTMPPDGVAQAVWAFPLVGIIVGLGGAAVFWFAALLHLPLLAAGLVTVLATVLLTGGLHEDGFADTVDGFGGGRDRERKLEIMKDSRLGAFGGLALIFSVGLRSVAIAALADPALICLVLVAAHAASRAALPSIMRSLDPVRPGGVAASVGRPDQGMSLAAAGIGCAVAGGVLGWAFDLQPALAILLYGLAAALGVAALARQQIGGYTGDVLGAAQQSIEIIMLLAASAFVPVALHATIF
jgi:adenosylcobinamide-GDP ribazoletransferase